MMPVMMQEQRLTQQGSQRGGGGLSLRGPGSTPPQLPADLASAYLAIFQLHASRIKSAQQQQQQASLLQVLVAAREPLSLAILQVRAATHATHMRGITTHRVYPFSPHTEYGILIEPRTEHTHWTWFSDCGRYRILPERLLMVIMMKMMIVYICKRTCMRAPPPFPPPPTRACTHTQHTHTC